MIVNTDMRKLVVEEDFPHSVVLLNEQERIALEGVSVFTIKTWEHGRGFFENLLEELFKTLLEEYKLYLVYLEPAAFMKMKVRSHKKMFHNFRRQIGDSSLFEKEFDLGENQSVLSAVISLTSENLTFCTRKLLRNFIFGLGVLKGQRAFPKSREFFLKKIFLHSFSEKAQRAFNLPRLLADALQDGKFVFEMKSTGADEQVISFYFSSSCTALKRRIEKVLEPYRAAVEQ